MRTLSSDTSPEAERVQIELLRQAPIWRKVEMIGSMNEMLGRLVRSGIAKAHPGCDDSEVLYLLDQARIGADLAHKLKRAREDGRVQAGGTAVAGDPILVIRAVIDALDHLGVPYYIGGSFASGAHGFYRATADADIVADLREEQADDLVHLLEPSFYADAEMVRDALVHHSSFNLLHLETGFKVDVFIPTGRASDRAPFERRVRQPLSATDAVGAYVASPEDTVLAKLEWYRAGNEVSERQWTDVLGVLKVQAHTIDRAYLRHWAAALGLTDLLDRAFEDAGLS